MTNPVLLANVNEKPIVRNESTLTEVFMQSVSGNWATVNDILHLTGTLHHEASTLFSQLRDTTQRERVDMVMKVLAELEEKQAIAVKQITEQAKGRTLSEWHRFEHLELRQLLQHEHSCHDDMATSEVIEVALALNDYLMDIFDSLANEAASEASRELFEGMKELERSQRVATVRSAMSVNDW